MTALPTLAQAIRQLTDVRSRVAPADFHRLSGTEHPGLYAWFVDAEGAEHLHSPRLSDTLRLGQACRMPPM